MSEDLKKLARAFREAQSKVESLQVEIEKLSEPIAIISMACRLPGNINSPEDYWVILDEGKDVIEEFPQERWNIDELYDPNPDALGKTYCKEGGFLKDIDKFDTSFFGISPKEAQSIDPQQRLFLETCWEALERAAIMPENLKESLTGVFVGQIYSEFRHVVVSNVEDLDGYVGTGSAASVTAGRISYILGLQGPAITVDTACSSSLVATHLAVQALRLGECDLALAGGVTVMLSPSLYLEFSRLKGMAADGRSKSFSSLADGAGWGEGCGVLVLKRLSDARRNKDKILAVIKAVAVNQDGRSQGLTAPNGLAQQKVILKALEIANLKPEDIDAVEAHGTGTALGDPIEANSLAQIFAPKRSESKPLYLVSSKPNIGHTQAAAGVAGIIKMVLALQHQKLPKSLYSEYPGKYINWQTSRLKLLAEPTEWKRSQRVRRCGVSSFGISGTNSHIILEEAPLPTNNYEKRKQHFAALFLLSGHTEEALKAQAKSYTKYIEENKEQDLEDICYSVANCRTHFRYRSAIIVRHKHQLANSLKEIAEVGNTALASKAEVTIENPKIVFIYPGQGSQWLGMGRELIEESELFYQSIKKCDEEIKKQVGFSIIEEIFAKEENSRLKEIEVVQPILFAMAVAITALWKEIGISPDVVVGHSQGEVAAAYIAGILTLEDAVKVICRRSQIVKQITGLGLMAVLELTVDQTAALLSKPKYEGKISIAVSNSPRQTVISGQTQLVEQLLADLEEEKIFCRKIQVDYASHSPQIEKLKTLIIEELKDIKPEQAKIEFISTVTTQNIHGEELNNEYWYRNLRESVNFAKVIENLWKDNQCVMIEQSSHPLLTVSMEEIRKHSQAKGVVVGSLKREQPQLESILLSLGLVHCSGVKVNWANLLPGRYVDVPTYRFQRQRYWVDSSAEKVPDLSAIGLTPVKHPLLGATTQLAEGGNLFTALLSLKEHPWLEDHKVFNTAILPGTGYLELAFRAAELLGVNTVLHLTLMTPIVLSKDFSIQLQLKINKEDEEAKRAFTFYSRRQTQTSVDNWVEHSSGSLSNIEENSIEELGVWPPLNSQNVDINGIYSKLEEIGLSYGNIFQCLKEVYSKDGIIYSRVELSQEQAKEAEKYCIHPALLDSALHSIFFTFDLTKQQTVKLPFEINGATLYAKGARELFVRLILKDNESMELNLFDGKALLVASIKEVLVRTATAEQIKQATLGQIDHLYKLKWQPISVGKEISKLENTVIIGKTPLTQTLKLPLFEDVEDFLLKFKELDLVKQIIIDTTSFTSEILADEFLPKLAIENTSRALQQLQRILKEERLSQSELVWITKQAISTSPDDEILDLANSTIWGLIRSVRNEYTNRHIRLIDVGRNSSENLLIQALAEQRETELSVQASILVPRLVPVNKTSSMIIPQSAKSWILGVEERGTIDNLKLLPNPNVERPLASGEVKIEVKACGLNFRDVLGVLGIYPGDPGPIGVEGSGVVIEVAEDVTSLKIGDKVMGLFIAGASNQAITKYQGLVKIPSNLSFAQAATIPVSFLTAYYGLFDLVKLKEGEKILIHAGTGGTGMAAVQLARMIGTEVFVTASPSKWKILYNQGFDHSHIESSRTLDFEEHFLSQTKQEGVDVVLNSLAGEFVDASLRLLPRGGRFLEIGKTDVRDSKHIADKYPGIEYKILDGYTDGRDRIPEILKNLANLLEENKIKTLPYKSYDLRDAQFAFRHMAKAQHIGKILLLPPHPLKLKGTVLITGGTGEIGSFLAEHLVKEYGVKNLLLTSRKGLEATSALELKTKLEQLGASVEIKACDVTDYNSLKSLIESLPKNSPLIGVIHTVGILDDGVVMEQTVQKFTNVMSAKVSGAWNLHLLTKDKDLELFVLFSSFAGIIGNLAQSNYTSANTFLDSLAHYRKKLGLAAQSLAWGFWQQQGLGMTSHLGKAELSRMKRQGLDVMSPQQGLALFDKAILQPEPLLIPAYFNLSNLASQNMVSPLLSEITKTKTLRKVSKSSSQQGASTLKQSLKALPESEQFSKLLSTVRSEIATVLALPEGDLTLEKSFQELGLDSLMAIEVRNRLSVISGIDLPTTTVFRFPTIHSLTSELLKLMKLDIETATTTTTTTTNSNNSREKQAIATTIDANKLNIKTPNLFRSQEISASPNQQRLWFLDQVLEQKEAYNLHTSFKINKTFDFEAFQKALEILISRHEQLRVCFKQQDGIIKQRVLPWIEPNFETYNLTNLSEREQENFLSRLLNTHKSKPFNLSQAPLFRVFIAVLGQNQSALSTTFHHIIIDGTSIGVFLEEFFLLYEAEINNKELELAPAPSYLAYSQSLNSWLESPEANKQRIYWQNQLKGLEALSLPTDRPQPAKQNQKGDLVSFELSLELSKKIDKIVLEMELTPFVIFSTGWSILLSYYSGQKDFAFGTFTSGRKQSGIEKAIGFFVNTLPIRCNLEANSTIGNYLLHLQRTIWEALDNQDLPYNEIVQASAANREFLSGGLFNTSFVLEEENWFKSPFKDVFVEGFTNSFGMLEKTAIFPLNLSIVRSNNLYKGTIDFLTDLFEKTTIEIMVKYFINILEEIVTNSQQQFSDLQVLTLEERNKLLFEWNHSWNHSETTRSLDLCAHTLFEQEVKTSPNKVAVLVEGEHLSYFQLNSKANQLAHYLKSIGVVPGKVVALLMERSIKTIVAILATLKAGGTYLPLDRNLPIERINFILEDAKVNTLLTDSSFSTSLDKSHLKIINIKEEWENISKQSKDDLSLDINLESLAYIIYTSGSTGNPKGVMVSHASLTSFIESANLVYGITSQDTVLQFAPISFDLSVEEIFISLTNGAKLALRSEAMLESMQVFLNKCQEMGITILDLPTAFWHEMVTSLAAKEVKIPENLRLVIIGGEKALNNKLIAWQKEVGTSVRLFNTYGPTEATVVALICELTNLEIDEKEIPIGRPLGNSQIYVLDKYSNPSPIGVIGELHIAGKGLAKGYLNQPELTAEKFIPNPFSNDPNSKLYKTGDLVRWLPNSLIEFIGRIDNQVKIRGFRIELGEIENVITQYASVRECVVLMKGEETNNKQLVAYVVAKINKSEKALKDLRNYLKTKLPDYMVPSTFLLLDELPLNPSGKIDRKALLKLNTDGLSELEQLRAYIAPRTNIEQILVEIWKEVLGVDRVGINDNFFELGGNSLKTIRVSSLASKKDININTKDIFIHPTIAELASSLDDQKSKSCLVLLRKGTKKGTIVYIPGAGGTLFSAPLFANALKVDLSIVGLTIPPLATGEPMPENLKDLCFRYVKELAGQDAPFVLIGHSFGGVVAFELAKELQERNQEVRQVILLDSWLPELTPNLSRKESLIELALLFNLDINPVDTENKIFSQIIEFLDFEKMDNLEPKTWLNVIFDAVEKSTNMLKGWKPTELNIPVHLIKASQKPKNVVSENIPLDLGWSKHIHLSTNKVVMGDHFSILHQPYVVETAKVIDSVLDNV